MDRISLIVLLFAVLPHMAYAGQGTIRETDSQFIVEYEGDANETIAEIITRDKEERVKEQQEAVKAKEVERVNMFAGNHAKLKEERRSKYNERQEE